MARKKRRPHRAPPQKRRIVSTESHLHHELFWIAVGVVFVSSLLVILLNTSTTNLTGHATVQTIAFLKGGQDFHMEVKEVLGVKEATVEVKETVKGAQLVFEEDKRILFKGKDFSKFRVSSNDPDKFGEITLLLKIKEQDLLNTGIAVHDLEFHANGQEYPLSYTKKEGPYIYYQATAPSIGEIVLGRASVVLEEPAQESPQPPEDLKEEDQKEEVLEVPKSPGAKQQPAPVEPTKPGFFMKILAFFANLF